MRSSAKIAGVSRFPSDAKLARSAGIEQRREQSAPLL
jgi:transposase